MKFILNKILLVVLALMVFQCQKERDKYYEEPTWTGRPMYEQLQIEGNFDKFLQCVDRSKNLEAFKGNGYWTVFAPNNSAMDAYLTSKGYASVADIPQADVEKLVSYSMLYNKYPLNRLTDVLNNGWDTLNSVKKRTPYYETLHREYYKGDSIWVVEPTQGNSFTITDKSYKYLPIYIDKYFKSRRLAGADYQAFYPAATYSGKNVQGASIVREDIIVANGVAHEVDRVSEPLPTLEHLLSYPNYSLFKNLIDTKNSVGDPYYYTYLTDLSISNYFQTIYPSRNIDRVYVKFYGLDVPLNCERHIEPTEIESNGYTLFAPNNVAVQKFNSEVLNDYGLSVQDLAGDMKSYFINAHMVMNMVWPSEYKEAKNEAGNFINGKGANGPSWENVCIDLKPASNGFFYGSNDYVKSPYFSTVLTEILLRTSKYLYMNKAIEKYYYSSLWNDLLKCELNAYDNEDYIVLLPTDEQLEADGFDLRVESTGYVFYHNNNSSVADARLKRLVRSHVFRRFKATRPEHIDTRIADFNQPSLLGADYNGYSYALNDYGDMVRFKDGKLQMLGNKENNDKGHPEKGDVTVTPIKSFLNGTVYGIDKLLQYTPATSTDFVELDMVEYIKKAAETNRNLDTAALYFSIFANNEVEKFVLNKEMFWTILLPNNAALTRAWRQGLLVAPQFIEQHLASPTFRDQGIRELAQAISFFKYHVLPGAVYLDDGYSQILLSSGSTQGEAIAATSLKVEIIKSTFLKLTKDPAKNNALCVSTYKTGTTYNANIVRGVTHSNLFAAKSVIHELDNCLVFTSEDE